MVYPILVPRTPLHVTRCALRMKCEVRTKDRLSKEALDLLKESAVRLGISQAVVLEMAIREFAKLLLAVKSLLAVDWNTAGPFIYIPFSHSKSSCHRTAMAGTPQNTRLLRMAGRRVP